MCYLPCHVSSVSFSLDPGAGRGNPRETVDVPLTATFRIIFLKFLFVCVCFIMCLMDREAWRAAIHGVAKNRTRVSD